MAEWDDAVGDDICHRNEVPQNGEQQIIDLFASKNLNHNGLACKIVPLISGWVPLDEIH